MSGAFPVGVGERGVTDAECTHAEIRERAIPAASAHRIWTRLHSKTLPRDILEAVCDKARLSQAKLRTAPESFVLAHEADRDAAAFAAAFAAAAPLGQVWIAKPAKMSCGKGITVFADEPAAQRLLDSCEQGEHSKRGSNGTVVLQKYVMSPLLLHGVKFDVRVHVVVLAGLGAGMRALVHVPSTYARLASGTYSCETLDRPRHLTNVSLHEARSHAARGDGESTRRWVPLHVLLAERATGEGSASSSNRTMMGSIHEAVSDAMRELRQHTGKCPSDMRMQCLGVDVLPDAQHRAWLLEVNKVPQMLFDDREGDCALVADMVRLAQREGCDLGYLELGTASWCAGSIDHCDMSCWNELEL
jgi:hypothetical protein